MGASNALIDGYHYQQVITMCGFTTEMQLKRLIAQVAKPATPRSTRTLISMMSDEWAVKLNGYSLDDDGLYLWEQSPNWIIDKHWGIDHLASYRGWVFGIDITTNTHADKIRNKKSKLLKSACIGTCPAVGQVDACAVWVVEDPDHPPSAAQVNQVLSSMVKQPTFTEVYFL